MLIDIDFLKGVDIIGYKFICNNLENIGVNYKGEEVVINKNIVISWELKDILVFNCELLKFLVK